MTTVERAVERYTRWVLRRRVSIVVVTLLAAGIACYGLRYLRINESWRVFFREDNPEYVAFKALEQKYSRIDNIFFGLEPAGGDVFTPFNLSALDALTRGAWLIPFAARVDSVANFQHSRAEGDEIIVGDLVQDPTRLTPEQLESIRQIALAEPLLVHRVLSADGKVAGVNVAFHMPDNTVGGEQEQAVAAARALAARIEGEFPGVRVHTTGLLMLNNAFKEAALQDYVRLMPVMYVVLALILIVFLRSVAATVLTLLIVGLSVATAEGFAGWFDRYLTAPATTVPPLVMTLAVADSIHIFAIMLREMRGGLGKDEALVRSMVANMAPVFLTSLTTVIGFLCMNFSE